MVPVNAGKEQSASPRFSTASRSHQMVYIPPSGGIRLSLESQTPKSLSDRGKDLVASACKKVLDLDIDGSIIGLNRDAAKKAISEHGEFVSERATVTWCEHS